MSSGKMGSLMAAPASSWGYVVGSDEAGCGKWTSRDHSSISGLVRADSIPTMDITRPSPNRLERHSAFVRASRFQRSPFDLLRLAPTICLHALGAM